MATNKPTEADVLAALANNDVKRAVELAHRAHEAMLTWYVLRLVRDPVLAADVQQDAWVAFQRALPRFQGKSSLKTWLWAIARHTAVKTMTRRRRLAGREGDAISQAPPSKLKERPLTSWRRESFRRRIQHLLDGLSPREREIHALREQGLSFTDCARILAGSHTQLTSEQIKKRANELRQVHSRMTLRLRAKAIEQDLVDPG